MLVTVVKKKSPLIGGPKCAMGKSSVNSTRPTTIDSADESSSMQSDLSGSDDNQRKSESNDSDGEDSKAEGEDDFGATRMTEGEARLMFEDEVMSFFFNIQCALIQVLDALGCRFPFRR